MANVPINQEEFCRLYKARYVALRNERATYEALWRDIRNFLAPRTARFEGEQINDATRQDLDILNTSPRMAVRALPAGMQAGVTSPMRPWFRLGTPDPELQEFQPVKEWLYDTERRMRLVLSRSNIYDRLKSLYSTLGIYGTGGMFIEEDTQDIARAHDFPMGTFMISTSAAGRVNTMFRDINMRVVQWVEKFGLESCPTVVRNCYDRGDYEQYFPVVHMVEPNRMFRAGSSLSQFKEYASVWLDPSGNGERGTILKYSGYDDQPMVCPRWDILGEDTWGFGCGEIALGDGKQLQLGEKRALQMLDQIAKPTMVGDASLRNHRTTQLPGDTTYVNGLTTSAQQGWKPAYQINNAPLNAIEEKQRQVERRIDEAFFKNLFLMVTEFADQPNITATQINTMREEKLMMLGPVLERLNDELLDPMIDRVFNIMARRGYLPPPPKEIQGMPLKVEYISVLAQAQKAMGIGNIERYVAFVGQMGQISPEAQDKINIDEVIDQYAEDVAIPPRLVRTQEEVQAMRAQRAQAQQMAEATQMGVAASQAAKNLSQTDLTGDNVMARALETAGAG
jgi:hypothetical protein